MAADQRILKEERIEMRATSRQLDSIDEAARALQKSRSDYMIDLAYADSQRVLADRRFYVLDEEPAREFSLILEQPAAMIPELRAMFEKGSVLGQAIESAEPLAG
jgi:uncharacterized protein (DUF1778 family)